MGGAATTGGSHYQGSAIAVVYVHMLAQRRLGWFGDEVDDVPLAVSGETGGPGDDIRIEFGTRFGTTEAQVKPVGRIQRGNRGVPRHPMALGRGMGE